MKNCQVFRILDLIFALEYYWGNFRSKTLGLNSKT